MTGCTQHFPCSSSINVPPRWRCDQSLALSGLYRCRSGRKYSASHSRRLISSHWKVDSNTRVSLQDYITIVKKRNVRIWLPLYQIICWRSNWRELRESCSPVYVCTRCHLECRLWFYVSTQSYFKICFEETPSFLPSLLIMNKNSEVIQSILCSLD